MNQPRQLSLESAARLLADGGVLAYPTEAVWGLGCDPRNETATRRLLALKQREIGKGLILIAGSLDQLTAHVDWNALDPDRVQAVRASWPGPHTWIVPASTAVPGWIRGDHAGVAVRVSAHPLVAALCSAFGGAIVSTSANRSGQPPPRTLDGLDPALAGAVDGILPGETSNLTRPTEIRDARSGATLRPA